MKQLDLSSYAKPVTFAETRPFLKLPFSTSVYSVSMAIIFTAAFIFIFIVPLFMGPPSTTGLIMLAWGIAAVVVVAVALYLKAVNRVKISRMANSNGLTASFDVPDPELNGLYFQHGDERIMRELIDVPDDGISMGTYQYVTGSGKSRQVHTVCFARTTLSRNLPHIVLDNVKNNFWKFSNLPASFSSDQKLSLEGDFNSTFTLYAPKEYERDALYIFTPDVMQAFVDSGYQVDAEIVDNFLYIYYDGQTTLADARFMESIYAVVQTLGHEVEEQSNYYRDDRVLGVAPNTVAVEGKRLKSGFPWIIAILLAYVLFNIIVSLFSD